VAALGRERFRPDPEERRLLVGYGNLADPLVSEAVTVLADVIRQAVDSGNRI
jgi:hypothetical protein